MGNNSISKGSITNPEVSTSTPTPTPTINQPRVYTIQGTSQQLGTANFPSNIIGTSGTSTYPVQTYPVQTFPSSTYTDSYSMSSIIRKDPGEKAFDVIKALRDKKALAKQYGIIQ